MGVFIDRTIETFELMAAALAELQRRVEVLEIIIDNERRVAERPLAEVDRSHHVAVGARADSSRTGS